MLLDLPLIQSISREQADVGMRLAVDLRRRLCTRDGEVSTRVESLTVLVPEGVVTGATLRLRGKGNQDEHGQVGDALVTIFVDDRAPEKTSSADRPRNAAADEELFALFDKMFSSVSAKATDRPSPLDAYANLVLPSKNVRPGFRAQATVKRSLRRAGATIEKVESLTVTLPEGACAGVQLRLANKGHEEDGRTGDLYLMIVELLGDAKAAPPARGPSWSKRLRGQLQAWLAPLQRWLKSIKASLLQRRL